MNGATAVPWVKTTKRPSSTSISTIGPSHHFLRTRMKAHSSPRMLSFSLDSSKAIAKILAKSVRLEQRAPVDVFLERRLVALREQIGPQHQIVHVRAHEAHVGVMRRADDRLAAHVERRVDQERHAGLALELLDEVVVQRALGR